MGRLAPYPTQQPPASGQQPSPWGQQPSPWGQPPQAWGQPPSDAPRGTNGFAIASLVFGLIGGVILSVLFGIIALVKIRKRPQGGRGLAIAGLVLSGLWLVIVIALIAVGLSVTPQQSPVSGGTRNSVNVFSLRTGDCFDNPPASQTQHGITFVTRLPCTSVHNAQVFVEFRASGTSYPGGSSLLRQADGGCRARVAGNIDKSRITSSMSLHFLFPRQQSWDNGHRTITCLIVDSSADLTSSVLVSGPTG